MIIHEQAYPRAGLVGNPSDGYFGKTIAFTFRNFRAEVDLYETPDLEILPHTRDHSVFRSIDHLAEDVRLFGYYGGIRLLKATIKRFRDYCQERGRALRKENFTIRYRSDIPHLVGLAGSSAIITACLRALMRFHGVSIPKPLQANLILSVETDELLISAGLQDRVAQVHQGLVYMDFDRELMATQGYGRYEPLDVSLLPPLYIAYRSALAQGSEFVHNDLRERYRRNDPDVLKAIRFWMDLADRVKALLLAGQGRQIGPLLDANFDMRSRVCKISPGNQRMVAAARSVGASAKFTGSGGAIVGTYADEAMFDALSKTLAEQEVVVIRPDLAPPHTDA